MKQFRSALIVMIALIGSAASTPHLALQVQRGLWIFNDTTRVAGDTVFPDTMKTPPGERTQRLEDIRRMISQPSRERECLTQASVEQRIFNRGGGCKQTIVANTPRLFEVLTECQTKIGSFTQETKERLLISNPASVTKSIHSVSLQAGKTMTIDSLESGRLVNSDCGNVHTIEQLP